MKELDMTNTPIEGKDLIAAQAILKQEKYIMSQRKIPGLKVWQLDCITGKVTEAKMESEIIGNFENPKDNKIRHKLVAQPNCIYIQALNWENAKRKFIKRIKDSQNPKIQKLHVM